MGKVTEIRFADGSKLLGRTQEGLIVVQDWKDPTAEAVRLKADTKIASLHIMPALVSDLSSYAKTYSLMYRLKQ